MRRRCAGGAAGVALVMTAAGAQGDAVHLRLHGAAHLEAQGVLAEGDEMLVRGALTDDAGEAVVHGDVAITIAREGGEAISLGPARSCATGTSSPEPRVVGGALRVASDGAGRFCVRVSLPIDRYRVHLVYAGGPLLDGAAGDVLVDLGRRACSIEMVPEPRTLSLDAKSIAVDAVATIEGGGATRPGAGLALTLANEAGAALGAATTDGAGQAHFVVDPAKMGPPGRGELRVAFAGNTDIGRASRAAEVERHTRVDVDVELDGASPGERRLPPGSPEDGVPLEVTVHASGGEVAVGSVEARVDDAVVGAAAVEHGRAKLVTTFAPVEGVAEAHISLRYVASAPWYEPAPERTWVLPIRERSGWRDTPLLLAGLGVLAWFVVARATRAARARAVSPPRPQPRARGEAKVDLVRAARHASDGWRGRVTDADDGATVVAARVTIERPAFGRAEVLATVVVDAEGRFELPAVESRAGDQLFIEAPLHVSLRKPLPAAGELDAQLVLRRRALLARLVLWARQRGKPFDMRPEPTPGHVRRAAGEDLPVARWADAIERAAFAGEDVDAGKEAEIDKLAPPPAGAAAPARSDDGKALINPTKAAR